MTSPRKTGARHFHGWPISTHREHHIKQNVQPTDRSLLSGENTTDIRDSRVRAAVEIPSTSSIPVSEGDGLVHGFTHTRDSGAGDEGLTPERTAGGIRATDIEGLGKRIPPDEEVS